MNNKWIKILLVASLALNVAFAGTYILRKINRPKHQKKFKQRAVDKNLKKGMNLTQQQRKEVHRITKAFRMNMLGYKQEILDQRIDIIESFNDPQLTQEDLTKKTAQLNELENQLNFSFVETLVKINDLLDTKQRLDFLVKLSKNWFFIRDRGYRPSRGGRGE